MNEPLSSGSTQHMGHEARPAIVTGAPAATKQLSIIIPLHNKIAFTKQCMDRIWRNTPAGLFDEIIIVDGASTDGTEEYFRRLADSDPKIVYHRCQSKMTFAEKSNIGAGLSQARRILFLNNDTLVQPLWLDKMVELMDSDPSIGAVGIKQLFPYTNLIYHTGMVFTPDRGPQHIYPFTDARLPHVNKQREYQIVNGACLLMDRDLFEDCGRFDEEYLDGYEDIDLFMAVRARGRKVYCCTDAYIYHYGQITRGVDTSDDRNAARFMSRWAGHFKIDLEDYLRADGMLPQASVPQVEPLPPRSHADPIYFLDDLSSGSALTWAIADLALALKRLGRPVYIKQGVLSRSLEPEVSRELASMMAACADPGGVQIKWSHYWPQHLNLELTGKINLEFFVINYTFPEAHGQPWDYWMQTLRQDGHHKLPLSKFCGEVLQQAGVAESEYHVLPLGYSREVLEEEPPAAPHGDFRFFSVTNSHDLERYGTRLLLDAYWETFSAADAVTLVIKDYGSSSSDNGLQQLIQSAGGRARIEYVDTFLKKKDLIALYRSCDAFVSAHRGEGFAMKILDAMACGLPVITPLFGGPADYCTPANCIPVDFALVPMGDCLDTRNLHITNQPVWCEPERASLRKALRSAFEDTDRARALGERGRRDIIDRFTWDNAARQLIEIIGSLGGQA